jgi:hypothetical protein
MKENKLKKAVEHINYEIEMFRLAAKGLPRATDQIMINFLLESFAIHAYNLFYFFYHGENEKFRGQINKRKPTDIIAEDYINNNKYFRNNRCPKKDLRIIVGKRNKQIAHLTYNRIYRNKKTKPWKFQEISDRMEKTISAFLDSLSDDRKMWFSH